MNKQELIQFICEMFQIDKCTDMILKQIHKYVTERRYDYLDIARALSYYVDVQGNTLELKYGIGIVPFVMDDARKYFYKLKAQKEEQIKAAQEAKRREKVVDKTIIYCPVVGKKTIKKRGIDITGLN